MSFEYFYKTQSDMYSFIRIPKAMMTEDVFAPLSIQSKLLYGLLLDRMSVSVKNKWIDDICDEKLLISHIFIFN